MKTCLSGNWIIKETATPRAGSWVTVNSNKHTCRISVAKNGKLIMYTSVRRSPEYPGYERRLGVAAYAMARNLGWEAQRKGLINKTQSFIKKFGGRKPSQSSRKSGTKATSDDGLFVLRLKGKQGHAAKGLIDGGFKFSKVLEVGNPSFNGCRKKKSRRL